MKTVLHLLCLVYLFRMFGLFWSTVRLFASHLRVDTLPAAHAHFVVCNVMLCCDCDRWGR